MNFESDGIEVYGSFFAPLDRGDVLFEPKKLEQDMKNHESPPAKPSIEEAPKLEINDLPPQLRYVFFGRDDTLPVIIASNFNVKQVECLVEFLKMFKRAICWTMTDIIGIPPLICSHKIKHKP